MRETIEFSVVQLNINTIAGLQDCHIYRTAELFSPLPEFGLMPLIGETLSGLFPEEVQVPYHQIGRCWFADIGPRLCLIMVLETGIENSLRRCPCS